MERCSVAIQHLVIGRLIAHAANGHRLAVLLPAGPLPCPVRPAWACKREQVYMWAAAPLLLSTLPLKSSPDLA